MAQLMCMGASLTCSFGQAPSTLIVTPENMVLATNKPAATIMDNIPMKNIPPFAMCSSPANPAVIAATAAKLGVFTPAPCVPVIAAPWVPGSMMVMIKGKPSLNSTSKLMCNWGGVIQATFAGQATVNVP